MVHGASKQTTTTTTPSTTTVTQPQGNETRTAPGSEIPVANNTDAMNQLSTAPPGTGPPPSLTETPEVSLTTEVSQANGNLFICNRQKKKKEIREIKLKILIKNRK